MTTPPRRERSRAQVRPDRPSTEAAAIPDRGRRDDSWRRRRRGGAVRRGSHFSRIRRRGGTLMRDGSCALLTQPISLGAHRSGAAASVGARIAAAGCADAGAPRGRAALVRTVLLPAVASRADRHLPATQVADQEPAARVRRYVLPPDPRPERRGEADSSWVYRKSLRPTLGASRASARLQLRTGSTSSDTSARIATRGTRDTMLIR